MPRKHGSLHRLSLAAQSTNRAERQQDTFELRWRNAVGEAGCGVQKSDFQKSMLNHTTHTRKIPFGMGFAMKFAHNTSLGDVGVSCRESTKSGALLTSRRVGCCVARQLSRPGQALVSRPQVVCHPSGQEIQCVCSLVYHDVAMWCNLFNQILTNFITSQRCSSNNLLHSWDCCFSFPANSALLVCSVCFNLKVFVLIIGGGLGILQT